MRSIWKRVRDGYVQFVEKQGFPIIVTVCVAVIAATALWSGRQDAPYVSPTPPPSGDVSAAQLLQQSLRDIVTPSPAPTAAPQLWRAPLDEISILRSHDASAMVQSGVTGLWAIHDAVDLQSSRGAKVYAMADGVVLDAGEDALQGVWILLSHADGVEALYAGLALNNDYRPGDQLRAGDVIGFVGSGPLEESDLPPHLHLRVTKDGQSTDPTALWEGQKQASQTR